MSINGDLPPVIPELCSFCEHEASVPSHDPGAVLLSCASGPTVVSCEHRAVVPSHELRSVFFLMKLELYPSVSKLELFLSLVNQH